MQEILNLIHEMSPYLLLGFGIAGVMHTFVPTRLYHRYLSGRGFRSVLYAAALGVPLPLCSCGVLPTAMSLRREGASKGATTSFLIATGMQCNHCRASVIRAISSLPGTESVDADLAGGRVTVTGTPPRTTLSVPSKP